MLAKQRLVLRGIARGMCSAGQMVGALIRKQLPVPSPPWRGHLAGLTSTSSLRHTHASLMLAAGVHPKVVSERLGHSSISVTMDIYSHVLPGLQEDAVDRLEKLLARSRE